MSKNGSMRPRQLASFALAASLALQPNNVAAGGAIDKVARGLISPLAPLDPLSILPGSLGQLHRDIETGAQKSVEQAGGAVITRFVNAGKGTVTTLQTALGETVSIVQRAGTEAVTTTVQKAGKDVLATYEKGWRDAGAQAMRSFNDTVDAGKAVAHFADRQVQAQVAALDNGVRRAREGQVINSVWGVVYEPAKSTEQNFFKATQESRVIYAAAQTEATAYGGPAGAAAFAAWYTYRTTGDANRALWAGVKAAVENSTGSQYDNMPTFTVADMVKKAAVAGAVGGIAAAAAGGDENAVKGAFLKSGSAVLVQGASDQLTPYVPEAPDAINTAQCISARDVDCLSSTDQSIGQWTGIDPNSPAGKTRQIVTGISELPKTQSIPIAKNQWVITWTMGQNATLEHNTPSVVLTNVGPNPNFNSTFDYIDVPKAHARPQVSAKTHHGGCPTQ
jgi:hypothetical protein